jgi:aminomethyltransferase
MVAFSGFEMPISYPKGIIHEHLHCRSHAGVFDISHMGQCLIIGDDAAKELERLVPSDITGLKNGQQRYTVLTNDQGGIIDDIIVTRIRSGLGIIVNASCKDKDFQHIASHLSNSCQFVELKDYGLIALQGPAAVTVMHKYYSSAANLPFMAACEADFGGINCTLSRCGYTGEDGFEISVANDHAEALVRLLLAEKQVLPIGLGARDTLRLEAGLCLYGHELNETITPIEAGLSWLVKKGRTDFPGAGHINRQLQEGPEFIRVGLAVNSKQPVREGSTVYNENGKDIGRITSGSYSPSLGKPITMAMLDQKHSNVGARLYTIVRNRHVEVIVTQLPFIPHRYKR